MTELVGRVVAINRYPVKSMQGEALERAEFESGGMIGDRHWGVVDRGAGRVLSAKREGRLLEASASLANGAPVITLPDGHVVAAGADDADSILSDWLGRDVTLTRATAEGGTPYQMSFDAEDEDNGVFEVPTPPERFVDLAHAHLLTTSSIAAGAAAHRDGVWDPHRFRPTVLIETEGEGFIENDWVGRAVSINGVVFEPFMPTIRCVMTTRAQPAHGLSRDLDVLKTLADLNNTNLGVYTNVTTGGTVEVGTDVVVG